MPIRLNKVSFIVLNRDFPFGFLPMTSMGFLRDFLPAAQICKPVISGSNRGWIGTPKRRWRGGHLPEGCLFAAWRGRPAEKSKREGRAGEKGGWLAPWPSGFTGRVRQRIDSTLRKITTPKLRTSHTRSGRFNLSVVRLHCVTQSGTRVLVRNPLNPGSSHSHFPSRIFQRAEL